MHNKWIDLTALWKIIVVGLICGAGLPAIFAIGLRFLGLSNAPAGSAPRSADEDKVIGGSVPGMIGAAVCFAIVLAAIAYGIDIIVATS